MGINILRALYIILASLYSFWPLKWGDLSDYFAFPALYDWILYYITATKKGGGYRQFNYRMTHFEKFVARKSSR